ncbi:MULTISPECIES: DUF1702 family protein [Micromonospora]|uniref:UnbL n=1 Tax=Micromonospora yangpuensis TaxID=683228 RepID=A0A1C6UTX1_9ACTN|nr:DUF1702 family protein [Micromonospora yangpuensis]GGM24441.1 enediyne biosynthesis protein [Micromonospora yangpuensis]SCL57524.1 Protein of unknown function [Micromonospora yangpuensis]
MTEAAAIPTVYRPTGWRRPLALHPHLVDFDIRGFHPGPVATRQALVTAAGSFLDGFNRELDVGPSHAPDLAAVPQAYRGFAVEGAAMAATLLDRLSPLPGRRFRTLLKVHRGRYGYLAYVGAGWALARLDGLSAGLLGRLGRLGATDPLVRWLVYDGYGFHQAFFDPDRTLSWWRRHPDRCDERCAIRYQGLGRSLWFRDCADPTALAGRISGLPAGHRGDVWSGVGLAATYAGGVGDDTYLELRRLNRHHPAELAQGAAFGAEARQSAGASPPHVPRATELLTGASPDVAAGWTWQARRGLDRPGAGPADFQRWRERIQQLALPFLRR